MVRSLHYPRKSTITKRYFTALLVLSATLLSSSLSAGVVAIIDSGVNPTGNLVGHVRSDGYDFIDLDSDPQDLLGHGTNVASTVVDYYSGASILPIRIFAYGGGNTTVESQGIRFAANHPDVQVINLSLAGEGYSEEEFDALQLAVDADKVVVIAAGNSGGSEPLSPARLVGTMKGSGIAVGAVDGKNRIRSYSNRAGDQKDFYIVAPDGGGGTSFSAPIVAAAASRVIDRDPHLTSSQAVDILLTTAFDLGEAGTDAIYGRGLLDLSAALNTPINGLSVPTGGGGGIAIAAGAVAVGYALYGSLKDEVEETLALDGYGRSFMIDLPKSLYPANDIGLTSLGGLNQKRPREIMVFELNQNLRISLGQLAVINGFLQSRAATLSGSYGRLDYQLDLAQNSSSMEGMTSLLSGGKNKTPFSVAPLYSTPYLGLSGNSDRVHLTQNLNDAVKLSISFTQGEKSRWSSEKASLSALSGHWRINQRFDLGFVAGREREFDGLLGGNPSSLFSASRTDSRSLAILAKWVLSPRMSLVGEGVLGTTSVSGDYPGMLQNISEIDGQAWGLGLFGRQLIRPDDAWGVALLRPFRITGGVATLVTPRYRNQDGSIEVDDKFISLRPSGRESLLEMFYRSTFYNNSFWEGRLQFRDQPLHLVDAAPQTVVMATIGLNF